MATTSMLILLDLACIAWVAFVLADPLGAFTKVIKALVALVVFGYLALPVFAAIGMVQAGQTGIVQKTFLIFVAETIGCAILLGGLFTLNGIWNAIKGVAGVLQLMISVPCWFVLGTFLYWVT